MFDWAFDEETNGLLLTDGRALIRNSEVMPVYATELRLFGLHEKIGGHYRLEFECSHCWLRIYDDEGRRLDIGDARTTIKVYRAGLKGCIIQVLTED